MPRGASAAGRARRAAWAGGARLRQHGRLNLLQEGVVARALRILAALVAQHADLRAIRPQPTVTTQQHLGHLIEGLFLSSLPPPLSHAPAMRH